MAGYRPSLKPEFKKGGSEGCTNCGTESTRAKPAAKSVSAPMPVNRAASLIAAPPLVTGDFLFLDGENDINTVDDILRINNNNAARARQWCVTYFGDWLDAGEDIEVFRNTLKRILARREYSKTMRADAQPTPTQSHTRKKPGRKPKK